MIERLVIRKTSNSPEILMDPQTGVIEIRGSSFLEDSVTFYAPVMDWIDQNNLDPRDTTVNVELSYFNSSAAKILITAFKNLRLIKKKNFSLTINWSFTEDDEDIRDSGIDFAKLTGLEFNMIQK